MRKVIALLVIPLLFSLVAPVQARGPWRASESNTRGWQLMTPAERIDHQSRIRSFTTYEECLAYQVSHHLLMEERARQRNLALPGGGRDFCEHLKRGKDSRQNAD